MVTRSPTPAKDSTPLPTLDDLEEMPDWDAGWLKVLRVAGIVAGAALAVGTVATLPTEAPQHGTTRAEEIEVHGGEALREAGRLHAARMLREIGLAAGWVRHPAMTSEDGQTGTGNDAMQPVASGPPQWRVENPLSVTDGLMAIAGPEPIPRATPHHGSRRTRASHRR